MKGSQEGTLQNRLALTFRTNYTRAGISALEAKVGMSGLQAEHGRNVVCALAEGKPMRRRNPDHAVYWEFSWAGSETGSCRGIHSNLERKSHIPRIQWPNIEESRGAGNVRQGLLDFCAD